MVPEIGNDKPDREITMIVKYLLLHVTQFAQIDTAVLGVIKATTPYESAIYSRVDEVEAKRVLKAALNLRRVFLVIKKEINDGYANNSDV